MAGRASAVPLERYLGEHLGGSATRSSACAPLSQVSYFTKIHGPALRSDQTKIVGATVPDVPRPRCAYRCAWDWHWCPPGCTRSQLAPSQSRCRDVSFRVRGSTLNFDLEYHNNQKELGVPLTRSPSDSHLPSRCQLQTTSATRRSWKYSSDRPG